MVNYTCGFNQSETGKYFEWIINPNIEAICNINTQQTIVNTHTDLTRILYHVKTPRTNLWVRYIIQLFLGLNTKQFQTRVLHFIRIQSEDRKPDIVKLIQSGLYIPAGTEVFLVPRSCHVDQFTLNLHFNIFLSHKYTINQPLSRVIQSLCYSCLNEINPLSRAVHSNSIIFWDTQCHLLCQRLNRQFCQKTFRCAWKILINKKMHPPMNDFIHGFIILVFCH